MDTTKGENMSEEHDTANYVGMPLDKFVRLHTERVSDKIEYIKRDLERLDKRIAKIEAGNESELMLRHQVGSISEALIGAEEDLKDIRLLISQSDDDFQSLKKRIDSIEKASGADGNKWSAERVWIVVTALGLVSVLLDRIGVDLTFLLEVLKVFSG